MPGDKDTLALVVPLVGFGLLLVDAQALSPFQWFDYPDLVPDFCDS